MTISAVNKKLSNGKPVVINAGGHKFVGINEGRNVKINIPEAVSLTLSYLQNIHFQCEL